MKSEFTSDTKAEKRQAECRKAMRLVLKACADADPSFKKVLRDFEAGQGLGSATPEQLQTAEDVARLNFGGQRAERHWRDAACGFHKRGLPNLKVAYDVK
jgi:hypothetical protein